MSMEQSAVKNQKKKKKKERFSARPPCINRNYGCPPPTPVTTDGSISHQECQCDSAVVW